MNKKNFDYWLKSTKFLGSLTQVWVVNLYKK